MYTALTATANLPPFSISVFQKSRHTPPFVNRNNRIYRFLAQWTLIIRRTAEILKTCSDLILVWGRHNEHTSKSL